MKEVFELIETSYDYTNWVSKYSVDYSIETVKVSSFSKIHDLTFYRVCKTLTNPKWDKSVSISYLVILYNDKLYKILPSSENGRSFGYLLSYNNQKVQINPEECGSEDFITNSSEVFGGNFQLTVTDDLVEARQIALDKLEPEELEIYLDTYETNSRILEPDIFIASIDSTPSFCDGLYMVIH